MSVTLYRSVYAIKHYIEAYTLLYVQIVLVYSALRDFFVCACGRRHIKIMRVSMLNYQNVSINETRRIKNGYNALTSTQKLYFIVITVTAVLILVHTRHPASFAASLNNITWVLPRYFCESNSTFGINWFKANFTCCLERKNAIRRKYFHVYISLFWRLEKSWNWSIIWDRDFSSSNHVQDKTKQLQETGSRGSKTKSDKYNLATLNS